MVATAAVLGVGGFGASSLGAFAASSPAAGRREVVAVPRSAGALVRIIGVFRRPQTAADLDPSALDVFARDPLLGTPIRSLIRRAARTSWGQDVYLVPVAPPTRAEIERGVARLPAKIRARRLTTLLLRAHRGVGLGVFGGGGGCCTSASVIQRAGTWVSGGPTPNWVVIVVPDGVARVSLRPDVRLFHRYRLSIPLTRPLVQRVRSNVAAFQTPAAIETLSVYRQVWFGPTGRVIKRFG